MRSIESGVETGASLNATGTSGSATIVMQTSSQFAPVDPRGQHGHFRACSS
jgi:hypothetical protein